MRRFIQSATAVSAASFAGEFFIIGKAEAFCPVCTVAAAGGVGLARWLGIDDTITGLWIGALLVSITFWTANWLKKKNLKFPGLVLCSGLFYILITVVPLYFTGVMGHPWNQIWGIDKLAAGMIVGAVFFYAAEKLYLFLKKKNNNHAHFPFEKVVLPVITLIILSGVFYFLIK
ncbi:MAG: hypothetical protein V1664_04675 [Candidatus Uhrbacteria bacterium]